VQVRVSFRDPPFRFALLSGPTVCRASGWQWPVTTVTADPIQHPQSEAPGALKPWSSARFVAPWKRPVYVLVPALDARPWPFNLMYLRGIAVVVQPPGQAYPLPLSLTFPGGYEIGWEIGSFHSKHSQK